MPTYAYECQACGTKFDQYQKFTDAPITRCPNCKKNKVRRVMSPAAIVFKGSGWYKTDSRSKSTSTAKNGDKPSEKSEATAEKTAESATVEKAADTSNGNNGSDADSKPAKPKKEKAAPKSDD